LQKKGIQIALRRIGLLKAEKRDSLFQSDDQIIGTIGVRTEVQRDNCRRGKAMVNSEEKRDHRR
jgi:hypothetical protein